jgi:hypothetical protein
MSKTPRNVRLTLALLLLACATCARVTPAQNRANAAPTPQAKAAARAAERSRRKAVALLLEVAAGVKAVEDAYQRASVLTVCADALWEADEQAARGVFARAWEAAAASDEEELKDEQENGRYGDLPERFTRARDMVLSAVARRDARMTEAWLGALADWLSRQESSARGEDATGDASGRDTGPLNEFTPDGQRLGLASSLLEEEAYDAAARVVAPSLKGGVSGALVEVLVALRAGSPEDADRLYLQLLAVVRASPGAGANDVLLLSTYALAPRLLAGVNPDGSVSFRALGNAREAGEATPPVPPADVRAAFYDTAAALLLPPPTRAAAPGHDPHVAYFAVGRLLPFFKLEAPRHAPALQTRMGELAAQLALERRTALDSRMDTLSLSPRNASDPLASFLDRARKEPHPEARDVSRLVAVQEAAKLKLWERARRVAGEIEDAEQRRAALALINSFQLASVREAFEGEDDDFERAAALAREAEATPALRAYGLAMAAEFAAKRGKREHAELLLQEAADQTAQAPAGSSPRDAAAMMTATTAARLNSPRLWEALASAVAALNEDEEFDGAPIWFNLETRVRFAPGEAEALDRALRPFTVDALFDVAALRDFERASAEARNLKSPAARSRALVAAARAALARGRR